VLDSLPRRVFNICVLGAVKNRRTVLSPLFCSKLLAHITDQCLAIDLKWMKAVFITVLFLVCIGCYLLTCNSFVVVATYTTLFSFSICSQFETSWSCVGRRLKPACVKVACVAPMKRTMNSQVCPSHSGWLGGLTAMESDFRPNGRWFDCRSDNYQVTSNNSRQGCSHPYASVTKQYN